MNFIKVLDPEAFVPGIETLPLAPEIVTLTWNTSVEATVDLEAVAEQNKPVEDVDDWVWVPAEELELVKLPRCPSAVLPQAARARPTLAATNSSTNFLVVFFII